MKSLPPAAFITLLSLGFVVLAIVGLCVEAASPVLTAQYACTAAILAALAIIQRNLAKIK